MSAPYRVRLPSGAEVRVRVRAGAMAQNDVFEGVPTLFGRAWNALGTPGAIERRLGGRWIALDRESVFALPLRDAHVLRDLLLRVGAIAPATDDGLCRNCDAPLRFDPRQLDPADLAERAPDPPPAAADVPLPAPLRLPRGAIANGARIVPVTLGEALPLFRALAREEPYAVTPTLLAAMGVRALGSLEQPVLLARVLRRAPDPVWSAIERAYLELNYARAIAPLPCPSCGAMHELELPWPRELDPDAAAPPAVASAAPFPSPQEFEALVERIAPDVYRARGVTNVSLRVEPGVPDTDIAGEPLLGSYEPRREVDGAGYTKIEFLVTLYYRTFRRMWEEDGPYDLEAEIRETIDHELEHHLHYLAGHDPKDAEERAAARRELRALYGERRLLRMAAREAASDVAAFLRATWPFLVLIAAGVALAAWRGWLW